MSPLEYWWAGVLLGSPIAALLVGKLLRKSLKPHARWVWGLGALGIIGLSYTPISLSGVVADHFALGMAYAVLWLFLGSSPSIVRYGSIGAFAILVFLLFVGGGSLGPLIWVSGDLTRTPALDNQLGCHYGVRMVRYGWVAHSGTEVVVYARPYGLPLEMEFGRKRFDDAEYEQSGLSATTIGDGVKCTVAVMYDGVEVWRP